MSRQMEGKIDVDECNLHVSEIFSVASARDKFRFQNGSRLGVLGGVDACGSGVQRTRSAKKRQAMD